jgi:aldehyde:ferredoxin oxidoreductase
LKRIINLKLGMKPEDDTLPEVWLKPYEDRHPGVPDGFVPDFEPMLDAYYQVRGWEKKTGYPSSETIARLGLKWVA